MTDVTISQKIKVVEATYKMRENILAKIAHEFKTPIMCVVGLSEEILNKIENNDRKNYNRKNHMNNLNF